MTSEFSAWLLALALFGGLAVYSMFVGAPWSFLVFALLASLIATIGAPEPRRRRR